MSDHPSVKRSHLFTVRVWHEDLGEDRREWRGRVEHVLSREATYFRGWDAMVEFVCGRAAAGSAQPDDAGRRPDGEAADADAEPLTRN